MIQNNLLGHYYTVVHNYCQEEKFPSPPPPMPEILSVWDSDFRPVQHEIESGILLASGKAVKQPMKQEDRQQGSTITGLGVRNGINQRRISNQNEAHSRPLPPVSPGRNGISEIQSLQDETKPSPNMETRPRISAIPSTSSLALSTPSFSFSNQASPSPSPSEFYTPQIYPPSGPRGDYFTRDRQPSTSPNFSMSAIAASKKKPPPPPPKRIPSNQGLWVTALYDFAGQGQGDLVFREGDKIKVMRKTDSTDDWWEGELKGVQGSFPANYCQAV